jgi:hypothetical protein
VDLKKYKSKCILQILIQYQNIFSTNTIEMHYLLFSAFLCLFGQCVQSFTCIRTGVFPDINSPDCTDYFICVEADDGALELIANQCPPNLVFHWNLLGCVPQSMFDCPNLSTTSSTTTTTTTNGNYNHYNLNSISTNHNHRIAWF